MALADVLTARRRARSGEQALALVPTGPLGLDRGENTVGGVHGPALSPESQKVLHDAWVENSLHAYGAPIDTADLLVGLLYAPTTGPILHHFGITVERVRATKRGSHGYQLGTRFSAVSTERLTKTQQVGRIARLVAEHSIVSGKSMIEPEDILEVLAVDGLGWGMGIMEELGLNERLLRDGLAHPHLLGDDLFAPAARYAGRWRAARAAAAKWSPGHVAPVLAGIRRASVGPVRRFVGWLPTPPFPATERPPRP